MITPFSGDYFEDPSVHCVCLYYQGLDILKSCVECDGILTPYNPGWSDFDGRFVHYSCDSYDSEEDVEDNKYLSSQDFCWADRKTWADDEKD